MSVIVVALRWMQKMGPKFRPKFKPKMRQKSGGRFRSTQVDLENGTKIKPKFKP